jgi:hypothetical protein
MRSLSNILLVVVTGIAAVLMLSRDRELAPAALAPGEPPPSIGAPDTLAPESGTQAPASYAPPAAQPGANASEASLATTERTTANQAEPGLFGQALDHLGHALTGLPVRLLPDGAREREAFWTKTDDDGRFAFHAVDGTFDCAIWSHVCFGKQVTVAPGERQMIVLQVSEPCVLLCGTVRAGPRAVVDRTIGVRGKDHVGDVHHDAHTDQHGNYQMMLRPGSYSISVVGPPTSLAWSLHGTTIWAETATAAMVKEPLLLTAIPSRIRRDFVLPAARVQVTVCTANNQPIGDASVTIRSDSEESLSWTRRTDEGDGSITFEELPAGNWTITACHAMHLPATPRMLVTNQTDVMQTMTLRLQPAGSARVQLMHEGQLVEPLNTSQLELHVAGSAPLSGYRAEVGLSQYAGTQFDAVPVGTHELHCADVRRPDGSILFAPIDPIQPHRISIEAGKTTELQVAVKPRPLLSLSIVGGPEMATSIEVTCGQGRVVPSWRGHDHWQAEVPPGDYTIDIQRGDLQHTEQIAVFQTDVIRTINLMP